MKRLCIDEDTSDKVCIAIRKLRPSWNVVFVRQWAGGGIKDPVNCGELLAALPLRLRCERKPVKLSSLCDSPPASEKNSIIQRKQRAAAWPPRLENWRASS